jgi:outer membrane protein assembly factor BamB
VEDRNRHGADPGPGGRLPDLLLRRLQLDLEGEVLWASGPGNTFGLGPYLVADDLLYALDDDGDLSLVRAAPDRFELLAKAKVLDGPDAWGPLALVDGYLFARDLRRMVCLQVGAP